MNDIVTEAEPVRKSPYKIKVLVFEISDNSQIREHSIDMTKHENYHWLINLIVWATNNHKSVEILNLNDDNHG